MSRRVIKAGQARFISEEGKPVENKAEKDGDTRERARAHYPDQQGDSLKQAIEEAKRQHEEEFRAAYDDLIAAAQDEVAMRLEDARREAQSLVMETQKRSEQLREEAVKAGMAEGRARAQEEMEELLQRARVEAQAVVERAEQERLRAVEETQPKMYRLALDIAEKILKYELNENQEAYMGILTNAMSHIRTEGAVTLHVNTAEFADYFGNQEKAKIRTDEGMVNVSVTLDPSVEPGGCLIETDSGVVDASIGVQLRQIAQGLGLAES